MIKRVMRAGDESGCAAVAMVVTKTIVQMQSKRLNAEAARSSFAIYDSVADAIAAIETRMAPAA